MKNKYPQMIGYVFGCILATCVAVCLAAIPVSLTLKFLLFLF